MASHIVSKVPSKFSLVMFMVQVVGETKNAKENKEGGSWFHINFNHAGPSRLILTPCPRVDLESWCITGPPQRPQQ